MIFDPLYLLIVGPGLLLAIYAQMKVKSAFAEGSKVRAQSGLSGAEVALKILQSYNLERDVAIEMTRGFMGDHYDPTKRILRLSPDVYNGRSLAALGVAAHEVGHAIQHAKKYALLGIRNAIVPMASIGSNFSYFVIFLGLVMSSSGLILAGVALFSLVVLFQLVNLPVEFDASNRAKAILLERGFIGPREQGTVASVLNAAALTYVAATVSSILTLAYYLLLAGDRE